MKVLSVTSECVPMIKTGGLADVAGALPGALAPLGVQMRTLIPAYPPVIDALGADVTATDLGPVMGAPARLLQGRVAGLEVLALDAPHLFARAGSIYLGPDGKDWPDNPHRFAALCHLAARIAAEGTGGWRPDLLHLHDWQAGLTPVYLRQAGARVPCVLTVHNIAFQGLAPAHLMGDLGLDPAGFTAEGFEYYGQIGALKAGLALSDKLTTVSPTYAQELMRPEFGMGLDGLLQARARDFTGILNGIDTDRWAPPYPTPKGKAPHKAALRSELGLPEASGPLCAVVSRLTQQKGLDLLVQALPALLARDGQLALLGSGAPELEAAFRELAETHANVAVRIGYDEALSFRMMAGADAMLVPSRFEPCGLTQLYALRHGTIPLVALTGGLADTVINASPAALSAGVATGVQFHPITAQALAGALDHLCSLHASRDWSKMRRRAMAQTVGWQASAAEYHALYSSLTGPA